MTISYSGNFAKLLLRWSGSIWKTVWKELLFYLCLYYAVRVAYRHGPFTDEQKEVCTKLIREFDEYTTRIPIMFLLGFYVAAVVKRWWEQFQFVVWPEDPLNLICYAMTDRGEETLRRKRTIARYLNLTAALSWREISVKVRKRFPSVDNIVEAKLMTADERKFYDNANMNMRWFLPLMWTQRLIQDYCDKHNTPAPLVSQILNELQRYRFGFRELHSYDWICIPLVYTQVAAVATYGYFAMTLVGRQFILPETMENREPSQCLIQCVDYYVPLFTIMEFLCYCGWFKVGQDLMRPFEEDDDDFELNYILDRNIQVCSAMVNQTDVTEPPTLPEEMTGWDQNNSLRIPHTRISATQQYHPPKLHAYVNIRNSKDAEITEPNKIWNQLTKKEHRLRYF